jgi:hypothetical protein
MPSQDEVAAQQNLSAAQYAHRNDPQNVINRLTASLPKLHDGGPVPQDGAYLLKAGEHVTPAPQTTQNSTEQADSDAMSDEEAVAGESVNLQRTYSRLHSAITALFDGMGVRRTATIPHIAGEQMSDHIDAVSKVLPTIGGVTANLLTASHTKHSATGGETVAHSADKLRQAIVPKDSADAKAAIQACKNFVNKVASLVGDEDPAVKIAKSQLSMIGRHEGQGMTAYDLAASLLSVPTPLIHIVARLHSGNKQDGHAPHLRAPKS